MGIMLVNWEGLDSGHRLGNGFPIQFDIGLVEDDKC
jgi:hypothetical protein